MKQPTASNLRPGVLLATGSSGGTISAVRELSRSGVSVSVISNQLFSAAAWSRFASRSYKGPSEKESRRFIRLLLEVGAASPGQVLLPTSDETAWLYTLNASVLKQYFRLLQPSMLTMKRILDKQLLAEAAVKAGLAVVPTWEPRSLLDVETSAPTLLYPILIKPRTHVHRVRNDKGMVAYSKTELIEKVGSFLAREHSRGENLQGPHMPLLQHFVDIGSDGVHSVSGYIDKTGELFVTRHAKKVFQRSLPAGVGVCFESLPPNPSLSKLVHRLCRELEYFGIFEVEFIRFCNRWAVIDFNPRLFNQAGMDAHRGMPLARLAYLDASGETSKVRDLVKEASLETSDRPAVFYDCFTLWAILIVKRLTMRADRNEYRYWRTWIKRNAHRSVAYAVDSSDRMPGLIHAISEIILGLKSSRRFLKQHRPLSTPPEFSKGVLREQG